MLRSEGIDMHAAKPLPPSMLRRQWIRVLALLLSWAGQGAFAQAPLPDPNLDLIGNGRVLAMLQQADGSLIVGGDFQSVNGVPRRNLARLLPDRTLDTAWNPSPDNRVTALAQAPGGNVYVGGHFDTIGGIGRLGLARLDGATGSVDPTWIPATRAASVSVDLDGSVFAVPFGSFNTSIVKLSAVDGSALPWAVSYERVDYIALDGKGALYAAAHEFDFDVSSSTYRATIIKRVASTGEPDGQWSVSLIGPMNSTLGSLLVDGDAVYAGGSFGLRKFSAATGQDSVGWNAPNARISVIAADAMGHILIGGDFDSIHSQPHKNLARLSAATGLPSPGWNPSADGTVDLIQIDATGDIDVAGGFQSVNQEQRIGLGRLLASTALSPSRNDVESPSKAFFVAAQGNGGVIVGGRFHRANALPRRNILRLNFDGTLDADWNPSLPSLPWVIATASDGSVYAAMNRWLGDERYDSAVARIDGAGHLDANWSTTADRWIGALRVASDGSLFVGGEFSAIGGLSRQALAKIDMKSGLPLPAWDAHIDCCAVESIERGVGDDLFIGGTFQSVGVQSHPFVAKISWTDGTADPLWNPAIGNGGGVYALAYDPAGSLYIGGQFWSINGAPRRHVAKVHPEGSGATALEWYPDFCWGDSWNSLYYAVSNLTLDHHGTVYATGFFCSVDFQPEWGLAKFSGQSGIIDRGWEPLASYEAPYSATVSLAGSIYIAGPFDQAGGSPRLGLAAFAPTLPDRLFVDGFEDRSG